MNRARVTSDHNDDSGDLSTERNGKLTLSDMNRRHSRRTAVMLTARIKHAGALQTVTVRNMSSHGALVRGEELPASGSRVTFRRDALVLPCRIVWVHQHRAGVHFDRSFDLSDVLRKIPAPRPLATPRSGRSGLKCVPISLEERRNLERWLFVDASQFLAD